MAYFVNVNSFNDRSVDRPALRSVRVQHRVDELGLMRVEEIGRLASASSTLTRDYSRTHAASRTRRQAAAVTIDDQIRRRGRHALSQDQSLCPYAQSGEAQSEAIVCGMPRMSSASRPRAPSGAFQESIHAGFGFTQHAASHLYF